MIAAVLIPIIGIIISLFSSENSSNTVQNVNAYEISGGIIGNSNTIQVMNESFSSEHLKLIEKKRQFINENIGEWYKYENGRKYLYHFNLLVDKLIEAAKKGESILFQEILREIHFLSVRLEKNNIVKKNAQADPGMLFYPEHNIELFLKSERTGQILGRVMNVLTRGVDTIWYFPRMSNSSLHLDSIYQVTDERYYDVLQYDTIFNYDY